MDSDKYSTQVERLGVVETGRRRRWWASDPPNERPISGNGGGPEL